MRENNEQRSSAAIGAAGSSFETIQQDVFGDTIDFTFHPGFDYYCSDDNTRVKNLKVRSLGGILGGAMVEALVLESMAIRYQDRLPSGGHTVVTKEFYQNQRITINPLSLSRDGRSG